MDKRKKAYFIKQKLIGAALIVVAILAALTTGSATASFILVPMGLYLIFSKKMLIFDDYFFEVKANEEDEL